MARTKIVKAMGRYGPRYGSRVKLRGLKIETKQRKKQKCPHCKKMSAKRLSKGIWTCSQCKKTFALGAYHLSD